MTRGLLVGLLVAGMLASGCTTAAKQGLYAVTGASSRYFETRTLGAKTSLDAYRSVQVDAFDASALSAALPSEVAAAVRPSIVTRVAELKNFQRVASTPGSEPVLVIRGKFVDYDPGGSGLRAVGFGGDPFLTAQIEVVDAKSGKVLGEAMVTGTVKSAIRTGAAELAEGLAKAVKGLLQAHLTKAE